MRGDCKVGEVWLSTCQIWIFREMHFDRKAQKYYHAPPMPAQAAQTVIDSLEFARAGRNLSGSLPVVAMARLQDSLLERSGEIRYELKGGLDARQRPVLTLEISGVLHLQCQRCLGALEHVLRLSSTLLVTSGADAGADDPDDGEMESIEASAELDVAGLVEDEILLSLPYAPRHGEGRCSQSADQAAGGSGAKAFAQLAALKRNRH